jgi:anti-sigma factor RsiW
MKDSTMHDPWTDRLSEYLDDELAAAERVGLERHLAGCSNCQALLADLRAVTAIAAQAEDAPPAGDLWPAIAARIGVDSTVAGGAGPTPLTARASGSGADRTTSISSRRPHARFSFTLSQLAAAATVLMALSGGAVWFAATGRDDAPVTVAAPATSGAPSAAVFASDERPVYESAIADLEQALAGQLGQLDPATVLVLQRSLATIDEAIEDARAAIQRDPSNPYLHRHLDGTMRKKMEILRRAATVRRAGT